MSIKSKFSIQTYNIGIIRKNIQDVMINGIKKGDIQWLHHKYKDRFFADPFLIKEDEHYYYFLVEEYFFWEEKGKITLLKVDRDTFTLFDRKVVIEEKTHLSFPFCEFGGNSVIPESVISGTTVKYTIDTNTFNVILKEKILDEGLIDAVFYTDDDNQWILTSKEHNPKEDLYIYKYINNRYEIVNNGRPIASDIKTTRSAGRMFKVKEQTYRPVQDSAGRYGRQTRVMKVNKLSETEYDSSLEAVLNSDYNPPYDETMHTFNVYDDCIIVDGSKDFFRFPMKILYKKFRWFFKEKK